ncbi:hypothetical protein B0T21DRAFT_292132 [Apiosordaria backusii]|uniref:Uncharacterized protein n=1 Tax=Apiosordaria backusii TaxID=314023 RepID=A0AA40B799_9PEZI|nr:hypothetical protein B0T21DRAFT_292132 [Apiosordaria backusii]
MSSDNSSSNNPHNDMARQQRRGSVTSNTLTSLFRSNSISQPSVTAFPTPLATSMLDNQRRRVSVATFGLPGTSPTNTSPYMRRASVSTNSDSIDESAIEDGDDMSRTAPITPFTRRMSLGAAQAMRGMRGGNSPGTNGMPSQPVRRGSTARSNPPTPSPASAGVGNYTWGKVPPQASTADHARTRSDLYSPTARSDQGFNWSDQLRSRAESTVAQGARPSFSFASGLSASPPRAAPPPAPASTSFNPRHDRARSVSDMPAPPAQSRPRAPQKPDHFQERILKGDFYMD